VTGNLTIVVDQYNHCLRSINRRTGKTSPHAGRCTKAGFSDGQLTGEALFNYPWGLAFYKGALYLTDYGNHALRLLAAGRVSTVIKGSSVLPHPRGLTFTEDGSVYITSNPQGLLRLDLLRNSLTKLTNGAGPTGSLSAAQLSNPAGLTFLSPSVLLITERDKEQLLLADIMNNAINGICDGIEGTRDGDIRSCQLDGPSSVLVVNQTVYVGQDRAIRKLPVAALGEFILRVKPTTTISGENRSISILNAFVIIIPLHSKLDLCSVTNTQLYSKHEVYPLLYFDQCQGYALNCSWSG